MTRRQQVLGVGEYKPKEKFVCFMPWISEFGWYIMNHVKRIHGFEHNNKIVCCKRGHECLFPSASAFFYDWEDYLPDTKKGGVVASREEDKIKLKINKLFGNDVAFKSPSDTGWEEKTSLADIRFTPKPKFDFDLKADVILLPRNRQLDKERNYKHWQRIADVLTKHGITFGVCGAKHLSCNIIGSKYNAWDYIDVDSDVEMILNAKAIIGQESGLSYLTMLCDKPLFIVDNCHTEIASKHASNDLFVVKELNPRMIAERVIKYIKWK